MSTGTVPPMALSHKLELRQSQSLVMTPQLMQAIKLLQLSNLDLIAYVDAELERNPLLERAEADDDSDGGEEERGEAAGESAAAAGEAGEDNEWLETRLEEPAAIAEKLDADLANVYQDDAVQATAETQPQPPADSWQTLPSRQAVSTEDYNLEAFVAEEKSLADHLSDQFGLAVDDPQLRLIGHTLINEIDEGGYMRADLGAVAERLGANLALVEQVLAIVQTLEPTGVGARDLAECLAIQLKERDRFDPAMQALIAHLDLLAKRDFSGLKKICGVDDEDLAGMIGEIRRLNPKPGHAFGSAMVQPIVPDVFVRPGPDGGWLVELNSDTLPKVLVNQSYYGEVSKTAKENGAKAYLAEALQTATWLVRALDQRARTILKVATEIVRQQDGFFASGVQHLRPLNLKTVADAIGMHESTVSRVTANKYMATNRGIFELKYFFTSSIASSDGGEAHSAEAVRHRIRHLIDAESAADVLSDDTIVEKLREAGIDIARRTVAKYREAMRIASSVQRRREKQSTMGAATS